MISRTMDAERRDFFISHASPDQSWAEWIADRLERAGYSVELDVWDWAAGRDFVTAMETALQRADRVIAVYSNEYFRRPFAGIEHHVVFSNAIKLEQPRLIPVLVEQCSIPQLYEALIYIDLVAVDEQTATRRLQQGVSLDRKRPRGVEYPNATDEPLDTSGTGYPGNRAGV